MRALRFIGCALACLALVEPARAQMRVEGATMIGGTWIMAEPPARFAIRSGNVPGDVIVSDAELATRAVSFGAIAGLRFGDRYGVEAMFQWVPTELSAGAGLESEGGSVDGDVLMYAANGVYHFAERGPFKPFFGLGIGAQTTRFDRSGWRGETEPMLNLVAGGEVALSGRIGLRLDARNCISPWKSRVEGTDDAVRTDAVFSAGLRFSTPLGG